MAIDNPIPAQCIKDQVKLALQEDIGQQDLTADLIPISSMAKATLISRESAILCGTQWLDETYVLWRQFSTTKNKYAIR